MTAPPAPAERVDLWCLGVRIEVGRALAERCRHLPRAPRGACAEARSTGGAAADAGSAARIDDGPDAVAALTATAVGRTDLLAVHAAVVLGATGAVVAPAVSGAGKSTLAAALVRRGFGYLSDEVLAVDRVDGTVVPFPRPLSLHATSWDAVPLPSPRPPAGCEGLVDPGSIGSVRTTPTHVSHLVVPIRGDFAPTLTEGTAGEGVAALLPRCFNHFREPVASLRALGVIARSARILMAYYREASDIADLLAIEIGVPADQAASAAPD